MFIIIVFVLKIKNKREKERSVTKQSQYSVKNLVNPVCVKLYLTTITSLSIKSMYLLYILSLLSNYISLKFSCKDEGKHQL
jgi:hypothetical protein